MIHPNQRRVPLRLCAVKRHAIQVHAQAGPTKPEIADLNPSASCLLGFLDCGGQDVAMKAIAAKGQEGGGSQQQEGRERQEKPPHEPAIATRHRASPPRSCHF